MALLTWSHGALVRRSTVVYNTGVETHDRVYIIRRPVIFLLPSEFSGERWEKIVVDGEMKNGIPQKAFGKEGPSFLLGGNENPATEKSRPSQFPPPPQIFHLTWKCHPVLLLQRSQVSLAAARLKGVPFFLVLFWALFKGC